MISLEIITRKKINKTTNKKICSLLLLNFARKGRPAKFRVISYRNNRFNLCFAVFSVGFDFMKIRLKWFLDIRLGDLREMQSSNYAFIIGYREISCNCLWWEYFLFAKWFLQWSGNDTVGRNLVIALNVWKFLGVFMKIKVKLCSLTQGTFWILHEHARSKIYDFYQLSEAPKVC